ncbi:MAG: 3'(2'),5'-bisphosphate nucleotidase CysQ [Pseudomonadota bacterium]
MPDPNREADLALLMEAAREAGPIARKYWGHSPEVWVKGDNSPVTEADLEVNGMLEEHLRAARPDYGWLSEETTDNADRLDCDRVFIVDPIDGTRSFVEGKEEWAHALAIAEAGRVVVGAVYLPMRDEMFAATLGGGSFCNEDRLRVSTREALTGAKVLSNKSAFAPHHWPKGLPEVERGTKPALAHRLSVVAQGVFDASISFRGVWEWDSAAGTLMVTEAGGLATDREGNTLPFNAPYPRSNGVVAATPAIHAQIIDKSSDG